MTRHYIVRCILRATSPEREQWIGHRTEAVATLLVASRSGVASDQIGPALRASGYELIDILSERPMSDTDRASRSVQTALARIREGQPLPIAAFEAVQPRTSWRETDWASLLGSATPLWALVDGVSWPEFSGMLDLGNAERCCLYTTLDAQTRALAPLLVRVSEENGVAKLLRARDPATHSLVLFQSAEPMDELRKHLRRFTMIRTPADPEAAVYFRFYDPRVLLDAMETLHAGIAAQLSAPLTAVALPVTPLCNIPDDTQLENGPIGPFDSFESCRDRLLIADLGGQGQAPEGDRRVSEPEFEALSLLMERRAVRKLARLLFAAHSDSADQKTCLDIAGSAKAAADQFGLATVKQVTVFARCQLLFGPRFWRTYPEANRILTDKGQRPWQKKDRLTKWMGQEAIRQASMNRTKVSQ